jgi:membrane peptidoglycan carboxypeptidase
LEMAAAYATIANDGVYHAPRFVEKVVSRNGKVLFEGGDKGKRAFSPQVARTAIQVMRRVVEAGTGTRARLPGRQVAGKTGTSQNYWNAWFVGFTPQLATAVWMGNPDANVPMTRVPVCGRVTGGCIPAMIWNAYMTVALEGLPAEPFPTPGSKIAKGKFIKDKYSIHVATTTTSSSLLPGGVPPDGTSPPPTEPPPSSTTAPPPPATVPTPTTTAAPDEKKQQP